MYTGWRRNLKYPLNRPLTEDEKSEALTKGTAKNPSFDERGGLVALNSTYIEWIDRRFRARGSGSTFGSILISLLSLAAGAVFFLIGMQHFNQTATFFAALCGVVVGLFGFFLFYWLQWGIDFFQKVYYPIRFNRQNRMIYVYRDKRDGGVLGVPWDEVYFHVGHGMMHPDICDIRGEVIEDETVKDTFALGPFFERDQPVREMWAFICRYMDKGPEAVGPDPRDRYVELSLNGSWKDCALVAYTMYGAPNMLLRIISIPLIAASTVTRWLVFKSCRMPKWPKDIEAACKVASNDPNIWPQPAYMDQFLEEMPEVKERMLERMKANRRRAREAATHAQRHPQDIDWNTVFGLSESSESEGRAGEE